MKDISILLMSIWNFIIDFPPTSLGYKIDENNIINREFPENIPLDKYLEPLKTILQNNIIHLAGFYSRFFENKNFSIS